MEERKSGVRRVNESCVLHSNPAQSQDHLHMNLSVVFSKSLTPSIGFLSLHHCLGSKAIKEVCNPYFPLFAAQVYVTAES